ncbi:hypothetical protein CsatB_019397 [Cannabis sativa]|uniref:NDR1/HIN1-like protein 1 n=1 Tax=Cannabis sativa TaxID=3483 RepID=UPI0029CA5C17|nr:NDR1/HIN1-like protein 1 [Cannabis sativa]
MSSKDCGHHGKKREKLIRRICAGFLIFLFIVLVLVLLIWAILQPSKPRFILQDVTVYAFNTTVPNFLTSNFQVTISSRNPNDKIGVYYDRLDVYGVYHNQQITYRTRIPPTYQGHKDVNVWSPFVYGNLVPVAPFNSMALTQDQANGAVMIMFKADGRVRWKVGTFISGRYHFYVKCLAFINLGNKNSGIIVGENAVKYQIVQRCSVNV